VGNDSPIYREPKRSRNLAANCFVPRGTITIIGTLHKIKHKNSLSYNLTSHCPYLIVIVQGTSSKNSTNGVVTVTVGTLSGVPLTVAATATGVSLQDVNPNTPDAKVLQSVKVCNSVLDIVNAVPLPF